MSYLNSFQISASGMALEKLRFDLTVNNIANMHNAASSAAAVYAPQRVVTRAGSLSFAQQYGAALALQGGGVEVQSILPQQVTARLAHEPGHPKADAQGNVYYPGIDHNQEMMNMVSALRAYEANVVAMNAARVMAARTLEIGG